MQPTRVVAAAEFIGRSLVIGIVTSRRGDSTSVDLRVMPRDARDPIVSLWRFGNAWAYPRVAPVWPRADVDPWQAISYSGPAPTEAKPASPQHCPACGSPSTSKANHCGQCGSPLDDVGALAWTLMSRAGDQTAGSETVGRALAALISRYTKSSFRSKRARSVLLEFIEADFTAAASAKYVRGEPARVLSDLTLAAAQDIHQTIADDGRVSPAQVPHAELILRYAPLEFGYWGAFKALVKALPVEDMPDAYAEAVARISSKDWSRPAPAAVGIEDIRFLGAIVAAASPKTVKYLARRARRDLRNLATKSPETYARVAARMILAWDRPLSRNAFAPAYVMLGARSPLDAHSKYVVVDPDMSSRRDAHPEIWDGRPDLAQQIFDGIKNSVEAKTWAYQVLEDLGQVPAIAGADVPIALLSSYRTLQLAAFKALARRPAIWNKLPARQWTAVFRNADDETVDSIFDVMSVGQYPPAAIEALHALLVAAEPSSPSRRRQIAAMFLRATGEGMNTKKSFDLEACLAAVGTLMSQSATQYRELWMPVARSLSAEDLELLRRSLRATTEPSAVAMVDDLLLEKLTGIDDSSAEANRIASTKPSESVPGGQAVQAGGGISELLPMLPKWISKRQPDPATLERVIAELVARAGVSDASQLAKIVVEGLKRGVDRSALFRLLRTTQLGRAVIWHAAATKAGSGLATLLIANADVLRLAGDELTTSQLASAATGQRRVVLRYIKQNPDRILRENNFGVAAATGSDPVLREVAISQLQQNRQMPEVWLALVESVVPDAVAVAREYLSGIGDGHEFRKAVLTCLDNTAPSVKDLGEQLLVESLATSEERPFWNRFAETDDWRLIKILLANPRIGQLVDDDVLALLDRRVLLEGHSRSFKELVKNRIDAAIADPQGVSQARISVLLELARGDVLMDREWALAKLAELALAGVDVDGLQASLVTTGQSA